MKRRKAPLWKKLHLRWGERRGRLAAEGEGFSFKRPALAAADAPDGVTAILTVYKRAGYRLVAPITFGRRSSGAGQFPAAL